MKRKAIAMLTAVLCCAGFYAVHSNAIESASNVESGVSFIMGDVSGDGIFNVSDVILLQKWLLAVPDANLANWKAADFCADNKLDVFDLCLMKRELIQSHNDSLKDIITFQMSPSKEGVEEFLAKYNVPKSTYENDELYNITPQEITNQYGFRIFKYAKNSESYLEYQENMYTLGCGFGGLGTVSYAVADLNRDGNIEIYFTYSWGSGIHRSQIGYFDTSTSKEVNFHYACWEEDMVFSVNDGKLEAYVAELGGTDFVNISAEPLNKLGEIAIDNGQITFNSVSNQALSPIKSITADKIDVVTLSAYPPEKSVELTKEQTDKLLTLLDDINLYEEDNSYNEYTGQWVQFDIALKSGEKISLASYGSFFIINRTGYRAEYEPCEALSAFANSLIFD